MAAQRYRSGPLELDHVQVAAPPGCEGAARAFYGELLGLAELDKPPALAGRGGAWFELGDGRALHVGVVGHGFVAAARAHPALRAVDEGALRALAARLQAAGAPVAWEDPLPGVVARLFTADPWGNRIELLA